MWCGLRSREDRRTPSGIGIRIDTDVSRAVHSRQERLGLCLRAGEHTAYAVDDYWVQTLTFPGALYGHGNFSRRLELLKPAKGDRDVFIDLSRATFVRPDGIAHLIAIVYTLLGGGYEVRVARPDDQNTDLYLRRTDFWGLLGRNGIVVPDGWEGFNQGSASGLIECQEIPTTADKTYNIEQNAILADRIRKAFEETGLTRPLYRLFVELGGNAAEHSESEHGAFIVAQAYRAKGEIEISVVDVGRGIRAALFEGHGFETDREAVRAAVLDGITGRVDAAGNPKGGGTGLASARHEATQLIVRSGTAVVESGLVQTPQGLRPARKDKMLVMTESACPALLGTIVTAIIRADG
jgi:hypothetical protein